MFKFFRIGASLGAYLMLTLVNTILPFDGQRFGVATSENANDQLMKEIFVFFQNIATNNQFLANLIIYVIIKETGRVKCGDQYKSRTCMPNNFS